MTPFCTKAAALYLKRPGSYLRLYTDHHSKRSSSLLERLSLSITRFQREKHHLQEDPTWTPEKELALRNGRPYAAPQRAERVTDSNFLEEEASQIPVDSRCEVQPGEKRGTVRWAESIADETVSSRA